MSAVLAAYPTVPWIGVIREPLPVMQSFLNSASAGMTVCASHILYYCVIRIDGTAVLLLHIALHYISLM
jgi:hypothetical protein